MGYYQALYFIQKILYTLILVFFFFCLLQLRRSYLAGSVQRCNVKETYLVNCAMDASYGGDMSNDRSGNIFFLDHLNFYNLHIGFWT